MDTVHAESPQLNVSSVSIDDDDDKVKRVSKDADDELEATEELHFVPSHFVVLLLDPGDERTSEKIKLAMMVFLFSFFGLLVEANRFCVRKERRRLLRPRRSLDCVTLSCWVVMMCCWVAML